MPIAGSASDDVVANAKSAIRTERLLWYLYGCPEGRDRELNQDGVFYLSTYTAETPSYVNDQQGVAKSNDSPDSSRHHGRTDCPRHSRREQ